MRSGSSWVLGFGAASVNLVQRRGLFPTRIAIEVASHVADRRERRRRLVHRGRRARTSPEGPLHLVRHRDVGAVRLLHGGRDDDAVPSARRVRLVEDAGDRPLVELPHVRLCDSADRRVARRQVSGVPPVGTCRRNLLLRRLCDARTGLDRHVLSRAGFDLRRQRILQAQYLDDGWQPLSIEQSAQGLGIQYLLHGNQRRCARCASRRRGITAAPRGFAGARYGQEGETLSPEQAASLRAGFLTAFYAAAPV